MLQVAYAGTQLNSVNFFNNNTFEYFEPGFNSFSPLEFSLDKSDSVYFSLRKRSDTTGSSFDDLSLIKYESRAFDITNGELIESFIFDSDTANNLNPNWDTPFTSKELFLVVSPKSANREDRVRVIDYTIFNRNDFFQISFRIIINQVDDKIHFLVVDNTHLEDRRSLSSLGEGALLSVSTGQNLLGTTTSINIEDTGDSHVLLSPFAELRESTKEDNEFSYPLNSIFYNRNAPNNDEEYIFTIDSVSHDFIFDSVDVFPVPSFQKVGVVSIGQRLLTDIKLKNKREDTSLVYMDINIEGKLSSSTNTFRLFFTT